MSGSVCVCVCVCEREIKRGWAKICLYCYSFLSKNNEKETDLLCLFIFFQKLIIMITSDEEQSGERVRVSRPTKLTSGLANRSLVNAYFSRSKHPET